MDTILTEREAASFLKISTATLIRLRRRREVPYVPGKPVRYIDTSLLSWMKAKELSPLPVSKEIPRPQQRYNQLDSSEMMLAMSC